MTKEEYIKRYSEEAYQRKKERAKAWYHKNKESMDSKSDYRKEYYKKKRDYFVEHNKSYYEENKEVLKEKRKKYWDDNHDILCEKKKEYREKNKDNKEYIAKSRINSHKYEDIKMGRGDINLTVDWYINHILNSKCIYCGETDWHNLGCDRIDNEKAHTTDNVVCACFKCNTKRGTTPFREYLLEANPSNASDILSSLGLE